jgi:hypothetical protein
VCWLSEAEKINETEQIGVSFWKATKYRAKNDGEY